MDGDSTTIMGPGNYNFTFSLHTTLLNIYLVNSLSQK